MMMATEPSTPPMSRTSSQSSGTKRGSPHGLYLDFSDLPPLIQPAAPSNTLLITNLTDPRIFTKPSLSHFRQIIANHCADPDDIYTFSPLRSMTRIIITFHTIDSAVAARTALDGEMLFSSRCRVYFGEPTRIADLEKSAEERQLRVPKADKQFFISPPPSPPFGWTSKEEGPPNKDVHADDLVSALEKLSRRADAGAPASPTSPTEAVKRAERGRSWSTIVFDPANGSSPDLPAIAVEDTTVSPGDMSPAEMQDDVEMIEGAAPEARIIAHTSRPPVELMD